MDYGLTFSILLYLNIFYFGLYGCIEFSLLLFKYVQLQEYGLGHFINELFILSLGVGVESLRLFIGQKYNSLPPSRRKFHERLGSIFQILVLTVPSMYGVAYLTLWQRRVTTLDAVLGAIMLILQASQFLSAFIHIAPHYLPSFIQSSK